MIPAWARVGAKVVCVRSDPPRSDPLRRGAVYTIARVYVDDEIGSGPYVDLVEVARVGWWLKRFRPLITIEDDISAHFAHLLNVTAPQGADA